MTAITPRHPPGMRLYVVVWIGLLLIVGIEVSLTYLQLPGPRLLASCSFSPSLRPESG